MQVQVMNRLSAILSGVDDHPISPVELVRSRKISRYHQQMPEKLFMFAQRLCLRGKMLLGNDQKMGRSLRINIGKCDGMFIFEDAIRGNLSSENFAK